MINLAFYLSFLDTSPKATAFIKSANNLLEKRSDIDIICFVNNQGIPAEIPLFATMNVTEAYNYSGTLVATCLDTAEKLLKLPGPQSKYFLLWDLEWCVGTKSYEDMAKVYNNENLQLLAKSEADAKSVNLYWDNTVSGILPDFEIEDWVLSL